MIRVTCAVIRNEDNEVLVVQRGKETDHPLKWEFPGGKVNPGETDVESVIREIKEELSMEIVIRSELPAVDHDYGHKKIRLIPFVCDTLDELPVLSEHISFKWTEPADLTGVDFSEADTFVAQEYLVMAGVMVQGADKREDSDQDLIDDKDLRDMVYRMMSMKEAEWIALSAIENPAILRKLLEYSWSDDRRLSFRASWTLSKVCEKFPEMLFPFLRRIIEGLDSLENESTQRSFLKILTLSDLEKTDPKLHGILTDHCFRALGRGDSAIAVKAYAMEVIYKLALIYKELANELSAAVILMEGEGSAGVKARGRIILKRLAARQKNL